MGRGLLVAVAAGAVITLAACSGDGGDAATASERITVRMTDNAYSPASFDVARGETVTFEFVNDGRMTHEAFIGDQQAQEDHATEMKAGDDHSMHMGGDEVVTVEPGASGSTTRTFDEGGTVVIGCHQPGHWESGMKATVDVA
jgi:uncharacterized cupredoxin-like copper-binding protein